MQKDTIWNTLLLGLDARNMAIIEITITVALATITFFFSESLIPNTPSNIFSVTLDEAAKAVSLMWTWLMQEYLQE